MLEFALGFAIMVPLVTGALQYTVGFVQVLQLESAVRAGALYGSQLPYRSSTATPDAEFVRGIENMVLFGKPEETGTPGTSSLRREHVAVEVTMESGVPRTLSVSIKGFTMALPTGKRLLNGSPASSLPYRGLFDPR